MEFHQLQPLNFVRLAPAVGAKGAAVMFRVTQAITWFACVVLCLRVVQQCIFVLRVLLPFVAEWSVVYVATLPDGVAISGYQWCQWVLCLGPGPLGCCFVGHP